MERAANSDAQGEGIAAAPAATRSADSRYPSTAMRIFLTGATGSIGRRLVLDRLERGDRLVVLSRSGPRATRLFAADVNPNVEVVEGDVTRPGAWQAKVDGCEAVINLAGAGVADRRWNAAYKREMVTSRVNGTAEIVRAIAQAAKKPRVLINASASGYYGSRGEETLTEDAPPGSDYLARLCVDWEAAARPADAHGVRVTLLRIGMVLDEKGHLPAKMLTPFRWFVGGVLGNGRQYWPWVHYRDVLGLIDLALRDGRATGAINAAAPNPETNRNFTHTLAALVNRPAWLRVPRWLLRLAVGEFAGALVASQRLAPARAAALGYVFLYPELEPALAATLPVKSPAPETIAAPAPVSAPTVAAAPTGANGPKPEKKIRLLAFDVDGTLLKSDGRVAQGAIDALRAAQRAGCVVLPASARPPRTTRSLVQAIGLVGPTINYNGAVIWNPQEEAALFHQPLDPNLAWEVITAARAAVPESIVSVEILDRWYTDRIDPSRPVAIEPDYIGPFESILRQPITKIDIHAKPDALAHIMGVIRSEFWSTKRVAVFFSEAGLVQVVHPLVDKGIALQRVAKRMGLVREEVMAIGDGPNDTGMIEWAGFGVAMGNADPMLRTLAKVSVPSNNDHGLARAIQRYVLT